MNLFVLLVLAVVGHILIPSPVFNVCECEMKQAQKPIWSLVKVEW